VVSMSSEWSPPLRFDPRGSVAGLLVAAAAAAVAALVALASFWMVSSIAFSRLALRFAIAASYADSEYVDEGGGVSISVVMFHQ